ncbi:MAG: TlpA family protein disulfide reductase [Nitrospinota bacterium]|nr:TlpA family protein disulfide reductase [Nitrospinota bacterium]
MTGAPGIAFRRFAWLSVFALICLWPGSGAGADETGRKEKAPIFKLEKPGGGQISSADIAGKVTLVNFWATWCVPCVREIPHLDTAYGKYRAQGFLIVGVNYQQDEKRVLRFMEKRPVSYPMALDTEGDFSKLFGVNALPVSILIDREGFITHKLVGTLSKKVLENWLAETLGK